MSPDSFQIFTNKFDLYSILKCKLTKRVQLLTYFMKNSKLNKDSMLRSIITRLEWQKQSCQFVNNCFKHSRSDTDTDSQTQTANRQLPANVKENLFTKLQNLLLYNIYLEENSIIEYVSNSNRVFAEYYSKIDIPTSVSVLF